MSDDPSSLARWVIEHPALWSVATGLAMLAVGLLLFGASSWPLAALVGLIFAAGNFWLWRRDGAGHTLRSYMLRRFPKD